MTDANGRTSTLFMVVLDGKFESFDKKQDLSSLKPLLNDVSKYVAKTTQGEFEIKVQAIFPGSIHIILNFAHSREQGVKEVLANYSSNLADVTDSHTLQPQVWVNSCVKYTKIFWDIDDCSVPENKVPHMVIDRVKEIYVDKYHVLKTTVVVGDVLRMDEVANDLSCHNCEVIHADCRNKQVTAVSKLLEQIKHFSETSPLRSTIILISSNAGLYKDMEDIKNSRQNKFIVIHRSTSTDPCLNSLADEQCAFEDIHKDLPDSSPRLSRFSRWRLCISDCISNCFC